MALIVQLTSEELWGAAAENEADGSENHERASELLQRNQIQAYREYHENNIVNLRRYESISSKYEG
jgi:hypothetical protein